MPIINEVSYHPCVKTFYPDGTGSPVVTNTSAQGLLYHDDRPATVKTIREADGWRQPTSYYRTVKAGRIAGADLDMEYRCFSSFTGNLLERGIINGAFDNGVNWLPSMPAMPENLYARAVNKALNKLKDQKVNLAVAFGERKETAEFVSSTLRTGADLARAIRKKDIRGVKEALSIQEKKKRPFNTSTPAVFKEVADAPSKLVLTNSYAFQPLVGDVYGVLEEFNRRDIDNPYRYKTKTTAMAGEEIRNDYKFWATPVGYAEWEFLRTMRGFHSTKVRLDYYLDNPFLRTLSQLGITNPVSLGWDLLPLSFVFDWFLPVGSYLSGIDAHLGLTFRGGTVSHLTRTRTEWSLTGKIRHWNYSRVTPVRKNVRRSGGKMNRLDRYALSSSPGPVYPGFKNPWTNKHVSDALALLAQAVQGKSLHYR